jgi:hypothetical protein
MWIQLPKGMLQIRKKIIRGIPAFPDLQRHLEANMEFAASKDVLKHIVLPSGKQERKLQSQVQQICNSVHRLSTITA